MYRCSKCGRLWDDELARDNEMTCVKRCDGRLAPVAPLAFDNLVGCDYDALPYPVALTATRLSHALQASGDVLKTLFLLKDCFEASIKYLSAVLLTEYRRGAARTTERTEILLQKMVRPSLGTWVSDVIRPLSLWHIAGQPPPGALAATLFAEPAAKPGGKPAETALMHECMEFVKFRNDALGHGPQRPDAVYESDLARWLPLVRRLLDGLTKLAAWRLWLVTDVDTSQLWLGPHHAATTAPGSFSPKEIGHFVLRGPDADYRDLYPFVCYLPDTHQENRLHYYDSLYRYQATKKEVNVLEYDNGERHPRPEPAAGLEEAFTAELLAGAFQWHRGRMEIIEGRVANFGELIDAHAAIVGRRFVIDHVHKFLAEHDRGLLVFEAQPGKGKTALMAHLIEEVFGQHAPRPVHFFYRRTAGTTDANVCVKSLYHALLDAHDITEADESKQKNSAEEVYIKLTNLLSVEVAPRLLPGRPQLLFIDALDEGSGDAFQRIPENLPAGVFIIATTRPVSDRTLLARRQNLYWYDLDAPDLLQANLRDGFEYVQLELVGTDLPNDTLDEIARIGAGNFLVLKLLCQHLRTTLPPNQVANFLRRLATDGGKDRLGFIYAEFWNRLTDRCTLQDVNVLCDVAGVLVTAHAPLTADMVRRVMGLRAGEWDFALRHLAEYLTVVEHEEDGVQVAFYRIYHESFADFMRATVATDRERVGQRLADYCLGWSNLPAGYARRYALRFAPRHLLQVGRAEEAATLLLYLSFLEAKSEAGMVFELASDFTAVAEKLEPEDHRRRWLELIEEAIRADIQFLTQHPPTLFQCLWNSCWWYDCDAAAKHYIVAEGPNGLLPWSNPHVRKLAIVLETWRAAKEKATPGFVWLRSLRPPMVQLGTGQKAVFRENSEVTSVSYSPDGRRIVSGSWDKTVKVWDVASGKQLLCLQGHSDCVTSVSYSPDGLRILSGSGGKGSSTDNTVCVWDADSGKQLRCFRVHEHFLFCVSYAPDGRHIVSTGDNTVRVWDADSGEQLRCFQTCEKHVFAVRYSPDGRRIVSSSADNTVCVWDADAGTQLRVLRGHAGRVGCVSYSPDGGRIVGGSADGTVRVWDADSGEQLRCFQGHEKGVSGVSYSPDGLYIVSSGDNTVRVWDADSGKQSLRLQDHEDCVLDVTYSPDNRHLVSRSLDRTARVWDVESGRLIELVALPLSELYSQLGYATESPRECFHRHGTFIRHPSGRFWAGWIDRYICILAVEGAGKPCLQEEDPGSQTAGGQCL